MSEEEISFIKSQMPTESENYVFSHNDLLANNVLVSEIDLQTKFIDFEYCQFNIVSYDIANYLSESYFDYNVEEHPYFKISSVKID
jgi:thiamine kinase-like enzyme